MIRTNDPDVPPGWLAIPFEDRWKHPNHIFGMIPTFRSDIAEWVERSVANSYRFLTIEDNWTCDMIAFEHEQDAALFLLRWS